MGKILLIIGSVVGGLLLALGLLALAASVSDTTSSPSDRNDAIAGSFLFIGVGLTVFAPCLFFLIRSRSATTLSLLNQGVTYGGRVASLAARYGPVDLAGSYVQWFGWCQREIGGNAVALHAATMAAMAEAASGNTSGAGSAARQAATTASAITGAISLPAKTPTGKIRELSRLGAGTLPLLEPGERVVVSFYGRDRQAQLWQSLFGVIGMLIAMSQLGAYFVTITDRRVIALTGPQLSATPTTLAFAVPRSMVAELKFRRGIFWNGIVTITRMDGGRTRIIVNRWWRREGALAQQALAPGLGFTPLPPAPIVPTRSGF
jgi:hypothetical protein